MDVHDIGSGPEGLEATTTQKDLALRRDAGPAAIRAILHAQVASE